MAVRQQSNVQRSIDMSKQTSLINDAKDSIIEASLEIE